MLGLLPAVQLFLHALLKQTQKEPSNDDAALIAAMRPVATSADFIGLLLLLDACKSGLLPSLDAFMNDLDEASPGSLNANASVGPALAPVVSTAPPTHLLMSAPLTNRNHVALSSAISCKPVSLNAQWSLSLQGLPGSGAAAPQVAAFVLLPHDRGPPLVGVGAMSCQVPAGKPLKVGSSAPLSKAERLKASPLALPVKAAVPPSSVDSPIMADVSESIVALDLL